MRRVALSKRPRACRGGARRRAFIIAARHLLVAFGRVPKMTAWFYILRLKSGTLYPGATTDLKQRWRDHVAGTACRTTTVDPPTAMVHQEEFSTFSEARRREAQIKRWGAKKKEALAAGNRELLRQLSASHDPNSDVSSP